jgi:ABC-type Fe3+ transport system substrate-binding protein
VLKGSWSPSSFGGSAGFQRLVQGMNKKYGLNIQAQFTPGIDEQAMASRLAQEAAANQPATEDVYLGNPAGVHDVAPTHAFKTIDWRAVIDRPIDAEGGFDPVAPDGIAVAFASSVVGITYNTNMVQPGDVPHRLNDLLDPKWKGKIASTPYASGWREFVANDLLGQDATFAFVRKFAPQIGGLIRCGESDRITSGEFIMLVMDCGANDVITLKRQGAPIDHALLDDAAVVHNRYGAVPVNSAAPNAAALFVAYLETPEAQATLWDVDGLDFYLFPEANTRKATDEIRKAGGKLALDSPQWLDSVANFSDMQKQLGTILQNGG